jgi:hypothetical protein
MATLSDAKETIKLINVMMPNVDDEIATLIYNNIYAEYNDKNLDKNTFGMLVTKYAKPLLEFKKNGGDVQIFKEGLLTTPLPLKAPEKEIIKNVDEYLSLLRAQERYYSKAIFTDEVLKYILSTYDPSKGSVVDYVVSYTHPALDTPFLKWRPIYLKFLTIDFPEADPKELERWMLALTGEKVMTFEKIKLEVKRQFLIKNNPDKIIEEAYKSAMISYPGIDKSLLLALVKEITVNGKAAMNFETLAYMLESKIKKGESVAVNYKDLRTSIYKGRIVPNTFFQDYGVYIFWGGIIVGGIVIWFRWNIIQAVLEYRILHTVEGDWSYIPKGLDLSSEKGVSHILQPSKKEQRENLEISSGKLLADAMTKGYNAPAVGFINNVNTRKMDEINERVDKLDKLSMTSKEFPVMDLKKEIEPQLKSFEMIYKANTDRFLNDAKIMNYTYKNQNELAHRIQNLYGLSPETYSLGAVYAKNVNNGITIPMIVKYIAEDFKRVYGTVKDYALKGLDAYGNVMQTVGEGMIEGSSILGEKIIEKSKKLGLSIIDIAIRLEPNLTKILNDIKDNSEDLFGQLILSIAVNLGYTYEYTRDNLPKLIDMIKKTPKVMNDISKEIKNRYDELPELSKVILGEKKKETLLTEEEQKQQSELNPMEIEEQKQPSESLKEQKIIPKENIDIIEQEEINRAKYNSIKDAKNKIDELKKEEKILDDEFKISDEILTKEIEKNGSNIENYRQLNSDNLNKLKLKRDEIDKLEKFVFENESTPEYKKYLLSKEEKKLSKLGEKIKNIEEADFPENIK